MSVCVIMPANGGDDTPCMRIEMLERLRSKLSKSPFISQKDADWKYAFDYYHYHTYYKKPLSMNCRPCYFKALAFIEDHFKRFNY